MGLNRRAAAIRAAYGDLRAQGRDPAALRFDAVSSPTQGRLEGRDVTLFGTNNYLGLTFDPVCVEAAADAARAWGAGTTGSRIANGSYGAHLMLEQEIAAFYARRGAVVFSTGYLANLGVISALAEKGDHLLIDADSHASIYDGCRLSDADTIRFRHNDPESLARRLARLEGTPGDKIIVVEGIYSMLGDAGRLREIAAVKREAGPDVYLLADEAHSLGVLGANGRGKAEADGVEADCDYVVGTFSKSVGSVGGFCVSDREELDALRSYSRPYMFTASMTPATVAGARAGFAQMQARPELRDRLWDNARRLYAALDALGFALGPEPSPVIAVQLADAAQAVALWNALIDAGLYTNVALPPATPNGISLLRVSVSAAHTPAEIDWAVEVFAAAGVAIGVLPLSAGASRAAGAA
ncbi:serine palmitoyltransferase [Albimonas pacifica]|uniref:Serine palmitoyltransferase n=1 Tax=Albimonas pacifica TaxID=1114924 RepID=A0A1I3BPU2_9RHOB|nr:aminotransferase class I/II-fold pyridoxal phosphate-dependent enzyme [Albimonas pacifica]SFH64277.1 serine palmitoyltransferase [Albimonas pacifica]